MFCTSCATENPTSAGRCRGCGGGLWEWPGAARPPGTTAVIVSPPPRRLVWWTLYGLPLIVLLLAGAALYRANWTEPAAWYARADAALATGRYQEAIDAFAAAGGFRNAAERREAVAAAFAPHRAAYLAAATALDAGRPEEAIALVAPVVRAVPAYTEASLLLADARRLRDADLRRQADAAEAGRDWLAAERALAILAGIDPDDPEVADRLAAIRRNHAPLVFTRERALWLVGADGEDERLLSDAVPASWPTWSPDRTRIAFTSTERGGRGIALYVVNVDGTGLTRLTGNVQPYAGPVWSPDGTHLAYPGEGGSEDRLGQREPDPPGIRVVDVATGAVTDLTAGLTRETVNPSWSPDGERIAFVGRAADRLVVYDTPPPGDRSLSQTGEVYVATLATGAIANVSRGRIEHPWRVAWSPIDDRLLVYTRHPGMSYDRDRVHLVLVDARTGVLSALSTGGERITMPVWSPDGRRIAYVTGDETLVVRTIGGGLRRIDLDSSVSRFISWGPDGASLLVAGEGIDQSSFLVPLAGDPSDAPREMRLDHDQDRRQAGAPQWGPVRPAPPPAPPTVAGTALDPGR